MSSSSPVSRRTGGRKAQIRDHMDTILETKGERLCRGGDVGPKYFQGAGGDCTPKSQPPYTPTDWDPWRVL
jgi:hypothetical protein